MPDLCGYTTVDRDGCEQPCDRPTTGWRWYQAVEHEDLLAAACDLHANEGGRRLHAAERAIERVRAEIAEHPGTAWDSAIKLRDRVLAALEANDTGVTLDPRDGQGGSNG